MNDIPTLDPVSADLVRAARRHRTGPNAKEREVLQKQIAIGLALTAAAPATALASKTMWATAKSSFMGASGLKVITLGATLGTLAATIHWTQATVPNVQVPATNEQNAAPRNAAPAHAALLEPAPPRTEPLPDTARPPNSMVESVHMRALPETHAPSTHTPSRNAATSVAFEPSATLTETMTPDVRTSAREEAALIRAAELAIAHEDWQTARMQLAEHALSHAQGILAEEREALRLLLACSIAQTHEERSRALAQSALPETSAYWTRIRERCQWQSEGNNF